MGLLGLHYVAGITAYALMLTKVLRGLDESRA